MAEKELTAKQRAKESWEDAKPCLRGTPFWSSLAFLLLFIGILMFCCGLYSAMKYIIRWLEIPYISPIIWFLLFLHLIIGLFFLFVATLATGGTRQQVVDQCNRYNVLGRCWQIGCIVTAYILHLLWLILPAIILIPMGLLIGVKVACVQVPDCIKFSDLGIPNEYTAQVKPEVIIDYIENFNESIIEKYAEQAQEMMLKALDAAEDSPFLENVLSKIEDYIPTEDEANKFIEDVVEKIDMDRVEEILQQAEEGVQKATDALANSGKYINQTVEMLPDFSDELDKVLDERPNLQNLTDEVIEMAENSDPNMDDETKEWNDDVIDRLNKTGTTLQEEQRAEEAAIEERRKRSLESIRLKMTKRMRRQANTDDVEDAAEEILEEGAEKAEEIIEEGAEAVQDAINKTKDALDDLSDKTADLEKDALDAAEDIKEDLQKTTGEAIDKGNKTLQEVKDKMEDIIANSGNLTEEAKELLKEIGEDAKQLAEETKDEIVDKTKATAERLQREAEKAVKEAKLAARIAAKEAQLALKKAEQAARDIAEAVDEKAKELAVEAEKAARDAAEIAQAAAIQAFRKARETIAQAEEVTKNLAKGAINFALEAAAKARQYSKIAIRGARTAARQAKKGAKYLIKWVRIAKVEIVKAYNKFLEVADMLMIEKKGVGHYCMGAKIIACRELSHSSYQFILVFVASILINLSMVHFLMAMACNWVHVTYEMIKDTSKQQADIDKAFVAEPGEKQKLVFEVTDSGSVNAI